MLSIIESTKLNITPPDYIFSQEKKKKKTQQIGIVRGNFSQNPVTENTDDYYPHALTLATGWSTRTNTTH